MRVDCEGCAGCCLDWRPLTDEDVDYERTGAYQPLDDTYNLTPLMRSEIRQFLEDGLAAAMTPRFFREDGGVTIDGHDLAAIDGKPVFFVGIRKLPKPVAPFDESPRWLPSCVFLDPRTLQCRIHDDDRYPEQCATYPGHNLALEQETMCERVEESFGGKRLLEDEPPEELDGLLLGRQALGEKLFVHPAPDRLSGLVERVAAGDLRPVDRAECLAVAAASSPGATTIEQECYEQYREQPLGGELWVDGMLRDWEDRASALGHPALDPGIATAVEDDRGAPGTPGWD